MLEQLDLGSTLAKNEYKQRLPRLQRRLHQLQQACWEANLATVILFEGWSAAGKGATIRKLTERLEPRGFDLHTTVAARTYESLMPWLWRFWVKVPNYGHMAIFDRSWYRPVRTARVEGSADPEAQQRAYDDIASFERALADDRYTVVKLFLHIDRHEQGRRLKSLAGDARTAWQVSANDWERHEQYDAYLVAAEEMLERTEAEWAPWTIIAATDTRWARIKVFETLIDHLEGGLHKHGLAAPSEIEDRDPDDDNDDNDDRDD